MSDGPALAMVAHWADVADEHSTVVEFLQWIEDEYGIRLDYDFVSEDNPAPLDRRTLVDQFFEVDREALERGRRLILKKSRERPSDPAEPNP